jgi:hypothetical protein
VLSISILLVATSLLDAPSPAPVLHPASDAERTRYPWLNAGASIRSLEESFPPPEGFHRVAEADGSFGAWLRTLPLRETNTPVRAFDGSQILAADDSRLAAVAELDVGNRDLQQCADSVIRLHAEWLWSQGRTQEIHYRFTSGDDLPWSRYANGQRPTVAGRKVSWSSTAPTDRSRSNFRNYLDLVFTYAGTRSIWAYSNKVERSELKPGDFFVLPAKRDTGHAVLILDLAEDGHGHRVALIGQGYMPAQDFHVLRTADGPWFSLEGEALNTPFWKPFPWDSIRRMP